MQHETKFDDTTQGHFESHTQILMLDENFNSIWKYSLSTWSAHDN